MNNESLNIVNELDWKGEHKEAFNILCGLVEEADPLALFELSGRYFLTEGREPKVLQIERDLEKSKYLAELGMKKLKKIAKQNDGEAMRMIAYAYLCFFGPHYKDSKKAEKWLLKATNAGCHFASNDLATFYQNTNIQKAKYWYNYATEHKCRVVRNSDLEKY